MQNSYTPYDKFLVHDKFLVIQVELLNPNSILSWFHGTLRKAVSALTHCTTLNEKRCTLINVINFAIMRGMSLPTSKHKGLLLETVKFFFVYSDSCTSARILNIKNGLWCYVRSRKPKEWLYTLAKTNNLVVFMRVTLRNTAGFLYILQSVLALDE